jgi:hypothetical protein
MIRVSLDFQGHLQISWAKMIDRMKVRVDLIRVKHEL